MGFIILSAIFAVSFAWMWERNIEAKKRLPRVRIQEGMNEKYFTDWKSLTRKRMSYANLAAFFLTLMPLPFLIFPLAMHLFVWPAILLALRSNAHGRKADKLAKELGIQKGLSWLASIKKFEEQYFPKNRDAGSQAKPVQTQTTNPMNNKEYELLIPEGKDAGDGYVELPHNTRYSLSLKNNKNARCDAEVVIDGTKVGTWRIEAKSHIRIERPVHDTGVFTFFEVGSREASLAGISSNSENGLISVTFKPELIGPVLYSSPSEGNGARAGATGLTGKSEQQFTNAKNISHDTALSFTIHIRLVSKPTDIRPLRPKSTPIPPPIG